MKWVKWFRKNVIKLTVFFIVNFILIARALGPLIIESAFDWDDLSIIDDIALYAMLLWGFALFLFLVINVSKKSKYLDKKRLGLLTIITLLLYFILVIGSMWLNRFLYLGF